MMQPPRSQRPRCIRPEIGAQDLDTFGRMQHVPFQPAQIARGAAQAQQLSARRAGATSITSQASPRALTRLPAANRSHRAQLSVPTG